MTNVLTLMSAVVVATAVLWTDAAVGQSAGTPASKPAASQPASRPTTMPAVKITISKETTFLLGPVRADGTIDYAAAIKEKLSKGVTADNNAAVLIIKAIGPGAINEKERPAILKALGLQDLPMEGDYLQDIFKFMDHNPAATTSPASESSDTVDDDRLKSKMFNTMFACMTQPWNQDTQPTLAQWVKANEKPLDLLVAASKLPKFYHPILNDDTSALANVILPILGPLRENARRLAVRAMLRLNQGDIAGAQDDIMAIHRMARLVDQSPLMISRLVAIAIDAIASRAEHAVATSGKLTAKQAMDFQAQLDALQAFTNLQECINYGERIFNLQFVLAAATGKSEVKEIFGLDPQYYKSLIARTNWDEVLRQTNTVFDLLATEAKSPFSAAGQAAHAKALKIIESAAKAPLFVELSEKAVAMGQPEGLIQKGSKLLNGIPVAETEPAADIDEKVAAMINNALAKKSDKEVTNLVCSFFASETLSSMESTMPRFYVLNGEAMTRADLSRVAFALAAFKADKGKYPAELSALVPTYLKTVPKDTFTGGDLIYKPQGSGYLLYSVGADKKDDGGKCTVYSTATTQMIGDDIAVQAK